MPFGRSLLFYCCLQVASEAKVFQEKSPRNSLNVEENAGIGLRNVSSSVRLSAFNITEYRRILQRTCDGFHVEKHIIWRQTFLPYNCSSHTFPKVSSALCAGCFPDYGSKYSCCSCKHTSSPRFRYRQFLVANQRSRPSLQSLRIRDGVTICPSPCWVTKRHYDQKIQIGHHANRL